MEYSHLSDKVKQRIYADQLQVLYGSVPLSMLAIVIVAGAIFYMSSGVVDSVLLSIWLGAAVILAISRVISVRLFRFSRHLLVDRQWEYVVIAGVVGSALLWSATMLWFFPHLDMASGLMLILLICSLQMGSATTTSSRPAPAMFFLFLTAPPILWQIHASDVAQAGMMTGVLCLYWLVVFGSGRRLYLNNLQNLELRFQASEDEALLRRSEQRFRSIVNSAGELVIVHDLDGGIIDVNDRACRTLGYSHDKLLRMHMRDICNLGDVDYHQAMDGLAKEDSITKLASYLTADGVHLPMEVCMANYLGPKDAGVLVLARDLSERNAREKELLASRQKLGLHIESTPLAVIEWDTQFRVTSWNPAAERIFGFSEYEAMGRSAYDLLIPLTDKEVVEDVWQSLLKLRGGLRSTNQNITKDARVITCEWYNTPLVDDNGKVLGVASLAMDISERMEAELATEEAMSKAEAANNAKSEFLSHMSHELRTPLNAVIGFSELLGKGDNLDPRQQEFVGEIHSAGHHLLSLVNEILDLSRVERGVLDIELESTSVEEVIGTTMTMIRPMAFDRQIQMNCKMDCDNVFVLADKRRLSQVLINLLSNAVKYNKDAGCIRVTCTETDGRVRIGVADTGYGIAADKQQLIFQPFERAGAEQTHVEGTGIGLMISKGYVEKMGGTLTFESTEGQGSTFWIDLPAAKSLVVGNAKSIA
jgi:PAS domain S-box-containing protein